MSARAPWPRPRAVLFDLDGCLVDSTRAITGCLNHALRSVGLPERPVAELVRFIGPPLPQGVATLLREAGADPAADPGLVTTMIDRYREAYAVASLSDTEVVPGIPAALDAIGAVATLAVVTSKPGVFARPILERLGLADRFAAVHAPPADHRGEDKAATLARALEGLGPDLAPSAAAMVGDRSHDVDAGRACGTRTVGVTWGAGDRAELAEAGADVVVDTPEELTLVLA